MTITDIFAIACLPMLGAGALCIAGAIFQPMGRARKTLVTTGILFFSASILVVLMFFRATTLMVANEEIFFSFAGLFLFLEIWFPAVRTIIHKQKGKIFGWIIMIFLAAVGLTFVSLFGWGFIGDFLLERQYLPGALGSKNIKSGKFGVPSYHLQFNGRSYQTTAEVYKSVDGPSFVRAEIGSGSNTIFGIEPVTFPQMAPSIQLFPFPPAEQN